MSEVRQTIAKVKKYWLANKIGLVLILVFTALGVGLMLGTAGNVWAHEDGTSHSHAETAPAATAANATPGPAAAANQQQGWFMRTLSEILLYLATLFIRVTLFILTFIIEVGSYNGYLNATAVNVGWVMVRDLTNMAFVVILLMIAFGTILGIEQYEWKKLIVKFVLAAILVNFSRVICGIFIDISQLVMTTFVNGIAATAGGNLINAFNLEKITRLHSSVKPEQLASPGIFTAAVAAVAFAGMTMAVMGIFLAMLVARLIRLWVLIVLSPLAFVLSVVPATQSFASQWWSEFGDNLVTGPVLLFFIWLSFVTVGAGDINKELLSDPNIPDSVTAQFNGSAEADQIGGQTVGIGDAMGWNQMANFAIAIGMLIAGAGVAAKIGGSSGSALTGVVSFGKKVATIASGYALGRWAVGKGQGAVGSAVDEVGKGAKWLGLHATPLASWGKRIKNFAAKQVESFKGAAQAPEETQKTGQRWDDKNQKVVSAVMYRTIGGGEAMEEIDAAGNVTNKHLFELDKQGKKQAIMEKMPNTWLGHIKRDGLLRGGLFGGFVSRAHVRYVKEAASEKELEKTKKFADQRAEMLKADTRGVPSGWFMGQGEDLDALDRREAGRLKKKKARSAAKTEEFEEEGAIFEGQQRRIQYTTGFGSGVKMKAPGALTREEETQRHLLNAARNKAVMGNIQAEAKLKVSLESAGQEALQVTAAAKELAATRGAQYKKEETAAEQLFVAGVPGQAALTERTEAEKAAHLTEEQTKEAREAAEREFYGTGHGTDELQKLAEIEARRKQRTTEIDSLKSQAKTVAAGTQEATLIATRLAELEKIKHDEETKTAEEEAKRKLVGKESPEDRARFAAMTPAEQTAWQAQQEQALLAMEDTARAKVRTGRSTEEFKEAEEASGRTAAVSEKEALEAGKAAEVRAAAFKAARTTEEEKAKTAAEIAETPSLKAAKGAEIVAEREKARQKTLEETAKLAAARGLGGVIEETKREEYKAGAAATGTKKVEGVAKKVAAEKERDVSIKTAKEAEFETQTLTTEVSALEEKVATEALRSLTNVVKRSQIAEADKKAATDVATRIKDDLLTEAYAAAHAAIEALFERVELDPAAVEAGIEELATRDAFVNAKIRSKQLAETGRDKTVAEGQFDEASYDAVVSVPQRSVRTPQTTIARAIEQVKSDLKLDAMERTEGQTAVATMIASLFSKDILKRSDKLALSAVIGAIDVEAWNDDVFDQIFDMLKSLTDGRVLTAPQRKRAEGMKRFADSMGWKTEDKVQTTEGREELKQTIKTSYGRDMSAQLQNIAGTGADRMLVRGASEINNIVKAEVRAKEAELNATRVAREAAARTEIMDNRLPEVIKSVVGQERYAELAATAPGGKVGMADVRTPEESDRIEQTITDMVFRSVGNAEKKIIDQVALGQNFTALLGKMAGKADLAEFWEEVLPGVSDIEARKKEFMSHLKAAQSLYTPATRNFTKNAYATKHYESAHNSQYDPTIGMQRPQNFYEAEKETTVDMSKMTVPTLAPAQIHSMIDMDMNSHLPKKVLESMYRAIFGQINEEYQLNQVNPRTVKKLFGYDPDEVAQKANGNAILGGSTMDRTENAGAAGTEERGRHLIRDILVPEIMGGHRAFLITLKNLFGHISSDQMNAGFIKTNIDGFGSAEKLSDLVKIIKKDSVLSADIGQIQIKKLERLVLDIEENGAGIGKKGTPAGVREAA